jgi:hypothetical protein
MVERELGDARSVYGEHRILHRDEGAAATPHGLLSGLGKLLGRTDRERPRLQPQQPCCCLMFSQ